MNNRDKQLFLAYGVWAVVVFVLVISMAIFLSSRPAGASHGQPGQSISYCCSSVNPRSGTSYRTIAMAFQPYRYTSVFEVGTQEIDWILQWPQLESTTAQVIRVAKQRLAVVLAMDAVPSEVHKAVRLQIDWQHRLKAMGMALLATGLAICIIVWPNRKGQAD